MPSLGFYFGVFHLSFLLCQFFPTSFLRLYATLHNHTLDLLIVMATNPFAQEASTQASMGVLDAHFCGQGQHNSVLLLQSYNTWNPPNLQTM